MSDAPSGSLTLKVHGHIGDVPEAAWNAMLGPGASPFMSHGWLLALEETNCVGPKTGWTPAHLALYRGDALIAACPSYVKTNSEGEFVFDWGWADFAERSGIRYYPKQVVAVPFTPATGDRVLVLAGEDRDALTRALAEGARAVGRTVGSSGVHVLFPREEEALAWEAAGYLRRDGFQYQWFRKEAATFDDYLACFTSKHRNQIKRELRAVREAGIELTTLSPEEHTRDLAHDMHAFYATTIEKHGMWGRLYLNIAFFERVVERFQDRLAWVVARDAASGAVVGGAFNVVGGGRLYGRYWGARVEVPYLHFAACYYEGVRFCIERRLDVFEPGAGGEHKRVRGFVPTLTRSAHWLADPRMRRALGPWLEKERARVRAIVLGEVEDEG